jgi:outer membrane protein assembly factor BamD (BamD/ComL family)
MMLDGFRRFWPVVGVCLLVGQSLGAPQSWELQDGRWTPLTTQASTRPVSDPTLDRAEELLASRQHNAARSLLLRWIKLDKGSPLRDRAIFLLAEVYYQDGDRIRSFYHLDELMDTFPDSPLFYRALEMQYRIADAYLKGYKIKFLGMPIIGAEDEAIEMLYRIQQRSPGSPLAERSLLRTADYYYANSEFDLAGDAYASYTRSYPRSPLIPKVRLREAFSSLARFRGLRFDATPLIDARAQLVDIINAYPELAKEENLPTILDRIDSSFAHKIYVTAEFYRRTKDLKTAAYNYRFLIKTYPRSPEATLAEAQLKRLPPSALEIPEPPAINAYAPATQPSAEAR